MTETELFKFCPALQEALQKNSSLRPAFERLLAKSLEGIFPKYLVDASRATVETLLRETERLDFSRLYHHRQALVRGESKLLLPEELEPVSLVTLEEQKTRFAEDRSAGVDSLANGSWASVAFAGGAGTRFFFGLNKLPKVLDHPNLMLQGKCFSSAEPKGVFPISPVGGLSFYEIIFAEALEAGVRAGKLPLVLLLTSTTTQEGTLRFLSHRDLWGFPPSGLITFTQAQLPRLDPEGDLIVADEAGHLSWTGDGHGGVYRALLSPREGRESLLEFLCRQGVRNLVMHNVDNPAARPFAPNRLGFHLCEKALFTLSVVRKTDPAEKVGLVLRLKSTGKVEVVEYNVLDPAVATARGEKAGRLLYEAGNTNTNLIATEAVKADFEPTLYTGKMVDSRVGMVASNSMELLNQHITRLLDPGRVRAFEVSRSEFFLPTKNLTGVDSVESTTQMLSASFARKLRSAGAKVSEDAICDLHPACGQDGEDLSECGIGPGWEIGDGARMYLCARQSTPSGDPLSEGSLRLEPGSSLVLAADRPYGDIEVDKLRNLRVNPGGASCVRLGRNIVIKRGVRVVLRIGKGACLTIPTGRIITQNIEGEVGPGEDREL